MLLNGFYHNGIDKCIYSTFTKDFDMIICLYIYMTC